MTQSGRLVFDIQLLISEEAYQTILDKTKDRDVILFLGNSKAGKSTIIDYLLGNPLIGVKVSRQRFKINIDAAKELKEIKNNYFEKLSFKVSELPGTSIVLVEAPGFNNLYSEAQDVANAFFIRDILLKANSAKLVIVSDIYEVINDNINLFINLTYRLHAMIPENVDFRKGLLITFTKDVENTSKADMRELFKEKILDHPGTKVWGTHLIKYFIENSNQVIVIKAPTRAGALQRSVFSNLRHAIMVRLSEVPQNVLAKISLAVSNQSHSALLTERATELSRFEYNLYEAEKAFRANHSSFRVDASSLEENKKKLVRIELLEKRFHSLQDSIKSSVDIQETLKLLNDLVPEATSLYKLRDIAGDISASITYVDDLLQIPGRISLQETVKNSVSNMCTILVEQATKTRQQIQEAELEGAREKLGAEKAEADKEHQAEKGSLSAHMQMKEIVETAKEKIELEKEDLMGNPNKIIIPALTESIESTPQKEATEQEETPKIAEENPTKMIISSPPAWLEELRNKIQEIEEKHNYQQSIITSIESRVDQLSDE